MNGTETTIPGLPRSHTPYPHIDVLQIPRAAIFLHIGTLFRREVAVSGYFPWSYLQTRAKTVRVKTLCRWLSRESLPALVDSDHKIAVWSRPNAAGRPALLTSS